MGIIMEKTINRQLLIGAIATFIAIPILIYALGDFPRGSILKETISIVTILAYFHMLAQFYLARSNKEMLKYFKMSSIVKIHKFIGYLFIGILLFHPFLIVLPRYFEAGVEPKDALITLLTSFHNSGVLLGMIAYVTMALLALTSLFRNSLPLAYKTWRIIHGILSINFIGFATFHILKLGKHANQPLSVYMVILASVGVLLLLFTYFFHSSKKREINKCLTRKIIMASPDANL